MEFPNVETFKGFCTCLKAQARYTSGALYGEADFILLNGDKPPFRAKCFLLDEEGYKIAIQSYIDALPVVIKGEREARKKDGFTVVDVYDIRLYDPDEEKDEQ